MEEVLFGITALVFGPFATYHGLKHMDFNDKKGRTSNYIHKLIK